jgi:hypothetical protein
VCVKERKKKSELPVVCVKGVVKKKRRERGERERERE